VKEDGGKFYRKGLVGFYGGKEEADKLLEANKKDMKDIK